MSEDDDPRIPPRYVGRTWGDSRFPPITENGILTGDFLNFQEHHGRRMRRDHPEYYCRSCRWRFAPHPSKGTLCGPCKAETSRADDNARYSRMGL